MTSAISASAIRASAPRGEWPRLGIPGEEKRKMTQTFEQQREAERKKEREAAFNEKT